MGKTFRRNDYRSSKWDKHGKKSRKQKEFEEVRFKHRSASSPSLKEDPDSPSEIPDYT